MKKLLILLLPVIVCWSCTKGEDSPVDTQVALNVKTGIFTKTANSGIKDGSAFSENGEELGLHVTTGTVGAAYEGISSYLNVKYTYNSTTTTWVAASSVFLPINDNVASVYAYYPYVSTATPANGILVTIPTNASTTKDYMFASNSGDGVSPANTTPTAKYSAPTVSLIMNHALAKVIVRMKANTDGSGVSVKSVGIQNASGKTALKSSGTMAITNGAITLPITSTSATTSTLDTAVPLVITPSVDFPIMVLPTVISLAGELQFVVTLSIGGVNTVVNCSVPLETSSPNWERGKIYSYTITSQGGTALVVSPTVTITPWIPGFTGTPITF
jgi:hypothetical protein